MGNSTRRPLPLALEDWILENLPNPMEIFILLLVKRKMITSRQEWVKITPAELSKALKDKDSKYIKRVVQRLCDMGIILRSDRGVTISLGREMITPLEGNDYPPKGEMITPLQDAEPAQEAKPQTPYTLSNTSSNTTPLTPLGESEDERVWIEENFGIKHAEEVGKLSSKDQENLGKFLSYASAVRRRAIHAYRSTTESVHRPILFVLSKLANPSTLTPLPESNIIDFEKPHEWSHKPWACLYKPKEFKGREHQEVLGLGHIVGTYGTGCFHETDRIYREQGFEAAMDYVWNNHPRNGYHKNARAQ